jgi:DUF971 family protein
MPYQNQIPTDIKLHSKSRLLDITFDDGVSFSLSCEFLRVNSPSAQVRGHGPGQEVLQLNKELVTITAIEPVGMYAVKLVFDDGHDSGLYNWEYLYELGEGQDEKWQDYLQRLSQAGHQRKAD